MNLLISSMVDGYKLSHAKMYADNTGFIYSNLTPRSMKWYESKASSFYDGYIVAVGMQAAVKEIVEMFNDFFSRDHDEVMRVIKRRLVNYTGDDKHDMIARWSKLHKHQSLPITIMGVAEGTKVLPLVPVLTIGNTEHEFFWLTNYVESLISSIMWKTMTNATIANEYRMMADHYAELTGTDDFTVSIQFHDFSMRGMSGPEDAARSGLAHLVSFVGSDNMPSMDYVERYYGETEGLAMGVPATEHAVATNNILYNAKKDGTDLQVAERDFLVDLLTRKFPTGIVSYVADSFDYWALITETLPEIKDVIMARNDESSPVPDRLVIRPDSGNPVRVICGYSVYPEEFDSFTGYEFFVEELGTFAFQEYEVVKIDGNYFSLEGFHRKLGEKLPEHEVKGTIECLWDTFGGTINEKGFKVLDSHIGLIYGDSITLQRAEEIFKRLHDKGFASGNVVLGVGSYTYQSSTRDTCGFAVKATASVINDEFLSIYKEPKTDSKKKSARGMLSVHLVNNEYKLVQFDSFDTWADDDQDVLVAYVVDGALVNNYSFDDVRMNLKTENARTKELTSKK